MLVLGAREKTVLGLVAGLAVMVVGTAQPEYAEALERAERATGLRERQPGRWRHLADSDLFG